MRNTTDSFVAGAGVCSCVTSLMQDSLGLERYIKLTREKWIDSAITVPLAVVFLLVALTVFLAARHNEAKRP